MRQLENTSYLGMDKASFHTKGYLFLDRVYFFVKENIMEKTKEEIVRELFYIEMKDILTEEDKKYKKELEEQLKEMGNENGK